MAFPDYEATAPIFVRQLSERFGDRCMIVLDDQRMSYAEADERSALLSRGLLASGVVKGTRVGILFPNGPDWVVAFLAVARIGAIAVPLNTFFQPRELGWVMRHADVNTLLTVTRFLNNDYLDRLAAAIPELADTTPGALHVPSLPYLRSVFCWGEEDHAPAWSSPGEELARVAAATIDDALLRAAEANVSPADPLLILYSSGSTADPKGAIHSHGGVIRHSFNLFSRRDLKSDDRVWSPMPFFWVGGLVFALMGNLHAGATTLCEEVFDPETTLRFLERERVTVAVGWPHFGKALADHPTRGDRDLSSLRAGNVPDLLPEEIVPPDPELRANALGMTETCGPHTWGGDGALPESLRGSFGKAVEGVEHKVVDPKSGEILPPAKLGEICVRGYSLMLGLYKRERSDTFDADGFYHTGDGGFFDFDGTLYFKGRLGDMIKTGGANVTPSEVEEAMVALPQIKHAYVVGVPHPERGQNVAAAVVLEGDPLQAIPELKKAIKGQLSAYKVPKHLYLYADNTDLPFTDSGKIEKKKLAKLLAIQIPT
jgi:acyl-CoA synthetase (AMP-forming)/AMP-acid ligase II